MNDTFIYKKDSTRSLEAMDYAIRFKESEYPKGYAKPKGNSEFVTDFTLNNVGYDVYYTGDIITKEEYDAFSK